MAEVAAVPAPPPAGSPAAGDKATLAQTPPKDGAKTETIRVKSYERAKTVKAKLEAEADGKAPAEPAAERETASGTHAQPRSSSAVDSAGDKPEPKPEPAKADDGAEERRAARAERMRKAAERERAEDAERQRDYERRARSRDQSSEVEKLRKRVAELEPHAEVFKDEETLLAAAEARGMSPEKLVSWMRQKLADPAAIAQRTAKTEADKIREELAELRREAQREREQRAQAEAQAAAERAGMQRAYEFADRAKASQASHPLTAKLVAVHGERSLIAFANEYVAPKLREDYSLEELHDHVEQFLDVVQLAASGATGTPAPGTSPPSKNGAAQPTTTLSNSIASQRVSVTEETPLAQMPRRERVRLLKEKLAEE